MVSTWCCFGVGARVCSVLTLVWCVCGWPMLCSGFVQVWCIHLVHAWVGLAMFMFGWLLMCVIVYVWWIYVGYVFWCYDNVWLLFSSADDPVWCMFRTCVYMTVVHAFDCPQGCFKLCPCVVMLTEHVFILWCMCVMGCARLFQI